jgi:hypothetical protein
MTSTAPRITLTAPPPFALPRGGDSKERDELQRELIHSPTAAPAGDEAGGPRDRASATLGVKCRGVPRIEMIQKYMRGDATRMETYIDLGAVVYEFKHCKGIFC